MLIYTPQETLCILVCIPESSFIKSSVIIIILLKGAHTNALIFVLVGGWGLQNGERAKCRNSVNMTYTPGNGQCPQNRLLIVFKTPNCCQQPSLMHYIAFNLAQCNNTLLSSLIQVNVTWRQNFSSESHKDTVYQFSLAKYPVIQQNVQLSPWCRIWHVTFTEITWMLILKTVKGLHSPGYSTHLKWSSAYSASVCGFSRTSAPFTCWWWSLRPCSAPSKLNNACATNY